MILKKNVGSKERSARVIGGGLMILRGLFTLSILAGVGALIVFRGCPICWTIGLAETVVLTLKSPSERK